MDYKKKYEEALEKVKGMYEQGMMPERIEYIFPELKESEDEGMMRIIKQNLEFAFAQKLIKYEDLSKMLAFLKQQGEQKPAKIEPKFHEGEWIVRELDNTCYQIKKCILNVTNNKYGYDLTSGGYISSQDANFYHLWTIQDAKAGDVLACNEEILLFKSYSVQGRISLYCWYNGQTNNFHSKEVVDTLMTTRNKICPATKEQRVLLFQKMHEAGYEWDAELKQLKKIEQKPAEWSEEDEKMIGNIIDTINMSIEDCDVDDVGTKARFTLEKERDWLKNILKSLRPQSHWRPSESQIDLISEAIGFFGAHSAKGLLMIELRNNIKKLTE